MKLLQQLFCGGTRPCWDFKKARQNQKVLFQHKLLLQKQHRPLLAPKIHTVCALFLLRSFSPRLFSSPKTLLKMKGAGLAEAEAFEESLKETSEQPGWGTAEKNGNICLPASENGKDGKELFKVFQEVINKNNELGFQREMLRLNIKGNFLTVGASSGSWWFLKEK